MFAYLYIIENPAPRTNTFVGTAAYISPEMLARTDSNPKAYVILWLICQIKQLNLHIDSPDYWAIGCTLYFFLFGTSPFLAATDYLTMKRVRALDYSLPSVCDPDAADLIRGLLVGSRNTPIVTEL